jgi:extracellular elastinolytic metalloproteinase
MKKALLFLIFFVHGLTFSQNTRQKIQDYLNVNKTKLNLSNSDISDWVINGEGSSETTKINNYYIKQSFQGIEIHNTVSNVWIKSNEVINFQNAFIPNISSKANSVFPNLSVLEALNSAVSNLNAPTFQFEIIENINNKEFTLVNGSLLDDPVKAKLVFQPVNNDENLRLAWEITFYTQDYKHLWNVRVDAMNGEILDQQDWVLSCNFGNTNHKNHNHTNLFFSKIGFKEQQNLSMMFYQSGSYRVFPFEIESPNHGNRVLLSNPHDLVASPFGWHDTNGAVGAEFTITRGNNVLAQEDADGNNGTGQSPNGGSGLLFDYPYGGIGEEPSSYTEAATTNLFYMNNIMHDVWYRYGFNEVNGNFQQNNYGRGGAQNDYVLADSQDGSGINNANFSTPVDGGRPRMQMFLWNISPPKFLITINSPSNIAGEYIAVNNGFDPGSIMIPASPGITQNLVLYEDANGSGLGQACTTPLNEASLSGKIVLINRGNCPFVEKVINAQNAGAIAVIIINNDTANPDQMLVMAGADGAITIPAISVSYNFGQALLAQMDLGNINLTIKDDMPFVNSDGDFDNGVIAHEYGHGISTRLTGGPNTNCLGNAEQMGEGWSDWFGLMLQMKVGDNPTSKRGIGTFLAGQPIDGDGIRRHPYSTDMSVNPFTFANTNVEAVPHGVGSVWATMLWDLAWAYVDKYGFDPDKYNGTGGNNKVMQLVLDGLKLQGCSPTFVSGRDALIAADQATTGGQDYCMIWEVFARRGLGVNASSGSATNARDQVEDFTTPAAGPNCTLSANYFNNNDMIKVYPNPTKGLLNISLLSNYDGEVKIQLFDLNGRKVYNENSSGLSNVKTLNIGQLQKGVYLLKIDGANLSYTTKVILN